MLNSAKITATLLASALLSTFSVSIYAENLVATPAAARLTNERVELPRLGFDSQLIAGYGEQVTFVEQGSKAFRLGLKEQDVILSLNGKRLTYRGAWQSALESALRAGGTVTLKVRNASTGAIADRQTNLQQY